jgi:hypothetical protein
MRFTELALFYAIVGIGCGMAYVFRSGVSRWAMGDAALLVGLWPLYGPFLLLNAPATTQSKNVLDALKQADGTPLSALLPDPKTATLLTTRLGAAESKVREIEALLRQPEFSEETAIARAKELEERGDTLAASMAQGRVQNIRRLRGLRDRFARELTEVGELLAQLRVQAELVRLSGAPESNSRDLTTLLIARVEGLGAILDDDARAAT